MNPSDFYVDPFLHCPQKMWYINKIKPQPFAIGQIIAAFCWGTRTRTRKDRTRICSVANYTIPQTFFVSRFPLDYGCKFTGFFHIYQTKVHFFLKKIAFTSKYTGQMPNFKHLSPQNHHPPRMFSHSPRPSFRDNLVSGQIHKMCQPPQETKLRAISRIFLTTEQTAGLCIHTSQRGHILLHSRCSHFAVSPPYGGLEIKNCYSRIY